MAGDLLVQLAGAMFFWSQPEPRPRSVPATLAPALVELIPGRCRPRSHLPAAGGAAEHPGREQVVPLRATSPAATGLPLPLKGVPAPLVDQRLVLAR